MKSAYLASLLLTTGVALGYYAGAGLALFLGSAYRGKNASSIRKQAAELARKRFQIANNLLGAAVILSGLCLIPYVRRPRVQTVRVRNSR